MKKSRQYLDKKTHENREALLIILSILPESEECELIYSDDYSDNLICKFKTHLVLSISDGQGEGTTYPLLPGIYKGLDLQYFFGGAGNVRKLNGKDKERLQQSVNNEIQEFYQKFGQFPEVEIL